MMTQVGQRAHGPSGVEITFERFFATEYPRLVRALVFLTGDRSEAEDLAQEAMVRAYERWERVRLLDSAAGYVYRTAFNLNRKRIRRLATYARRVAMAPSRDSVTTSPEVGHELMEALRALSHAQRAALILTEWVGLNSEEAAAILNVAPATVRVRTHRGRQALAEQLRRDDE